MVWPEGAIFMFGACQTLNPTLCDDSQAKKAGSDEVSKADSKGGSDDQLITNEVTT
jgi:hypothetical protein